MTYTPDQVAQAIIAEGQSARTTGTPETQHPVITPRGIQIALATAIVESNDRVLANPDDPASEALPHDGDGLDHDSEGEFQQRPQWWGTVAERMDVRLSAAMFYNHLAKLDYNDLGTSPGTFAYRVQNCAPEYAGRYDQHFVEAVAQYDRLTTGAPTMNRPDFNEYPRWSDNSQDRNGTKIDLWLIHTEEGGGGNDAADNLATYLISTTNTSNPVSYHYTISQASDGGVTVVDVVDTDLASWSVGNSNNRSINSCFAGSRAAWTRDQWMLQAKAIDVAAYLCVQDCQKYGISMKVIVPPYNSDPPGISDHRYCTQHLKDGNTHTDVGDNFPWDVFTAAVVKYSGQQQPAQPVVPPDYQRLTYEQLAGPVQPDGYGHGWPQLNGLSVVDFLAQLGQKIDAMTKES